MSKANAYEVQGTVEASPEIVFSILADAASWPSWARPLVLMAHWERIGTTERGGIGAIRSVGLWPFMVREEITAYDFPSRISYRLVGHWIPVRNYDATIQLAAGTDNDTRLTWSATFDSLLPGPLTRWIVKSTVLFMVWRLGPEAKRQTASRG